MIELFGQYIATGKSLEDKINRLREALQLLCLKTMQDSGAFSEVAFVGGTALRILYDLRRFSEDLDFSVVSDKGLDFSKLMLDIERGFIQFGVRVEARAKTKNTVYASMIKFPGLLNSLGLSPMQAQKFSIKLEIDSNPPAGWQVEDTVINKIFLVNIRHMPLSSLFATKLHACLYRKYVKGRDYYDLLWYLGRKVKPNYELLNNAIKQTQKIDAGVSPSNIKPILLARLDKIDFSPIVGDVERFLEDKNEAALLTKDVIGKSIEDAFG